MDKIKERNQTIDILRGISAIAVLVGHAIQRGLITGFDDNMLFKLIYTFHMPLFMFLSGYTLFISNPKYDNKFIIKKFKRLMIPTYVFSILLYFVKDLNFTGLKPFVKFPDHFINYLALLVIKPDFLIWFLYVVFVGTLIFFVGQKYFRRYFNLYLIVATISVLFFPIGGIFGIARLRLHLPIFIAGYFVAKHKKIVFKYLRYMLLPLVVFYIFMADNWSFASPLTYQWLIAIAGMTILYYIVKIVRIKFLDDIFIFLGDYSMEIYVWQVFVLNIGIGTGVKRVWTIFISATILSIILAYITRKNKYTNKFLYGRF